MKSLNLFLMWICLLACDFAVRASNATLTPSAKFSVITCSPGPDLYSLFGHSALRLPDTLAGRPIDVVFNYGTFDYEEEGFYVKFARGKLDYRLQDEYFDYFLASYAQEGRGVWEQELLITPLEKQRLFDLLIENLQQENRVYRYDFFFDNCSSRIRDMIVRATAQEPNDAWGFRYVSLDTLLSINRIEFTHPCAAGTTYREAIQTYLDFQPWSDLGIDLALGRPCDDVIGDYGFMFLPDSLMRELKFASLDGQPLCAEEVEILPSRLQLTANPLTSPLVLFTLWLALHCWIAYRNRKSTAHFLWTDRLVLIVTAVVSLLVIFLWFFTDHSATKFNWNLLWASPLHLLLLFTKQKPRLTSAFAIINMIGCTAVILGYFLLPQSIHPAVIPLSLMLIITNYRLYRNARIIEH